MDDWLDFELVVGDHYRELDDSADVVLNMSNKYEPTVYYIHVFGEVADKEYDDYHRVYADPNINSYDKLAEHVYELVLQGEIKRINDILRLEQLANMMPNARGV